MDQAGSLSQVRHRPGQECRLGLEPNSEIERPGGQALCSPPLTLDAPGLQERGFGIREEVGLEVIGTRGITKGRGRGRTS